MMVRSLRSTALLIVIVILAALVASYLYAITSKPALDDEARQAAPGSFIRLSRGMVHYEMTGPEHAETVVLIHGLATPSFIWDHNVAALVSAGFRVLRYDHYGRGFSDRPDVVYDRDLYDQQLVELLQKLNVKPPVHLVGLSMGGAVATIFTDRHPDMVAKLCLIAPAGFPIEESLAVKLAKMPVIGDYLMAMIGDRIVLEGVKEAFVDPEKLPEFEEKFKVPLQYAGFQRALLSTLRHMDMDNLSETYQRVGKQQKPVLLLWGSKDQVLPFANSEKVREAIPQLVFRDVAGAGHNLNYENPEIVNPVLYEFLSDRES
ncbi:MAG: alpha/beta hydrolase [Proteobacteria bacterium]|nr:alpha/beta hydrolase [Pseudomonadota bacterium]